MTLNDVISLVNVTEKMGTNGYKTKIETLTVVKCDSGKGVTRTEFYEAYKAGIQLTAVFELWACDYGGQKQIVHNGTRYKVERAYPTQEGGMQLNCSEVTR